MLRVLQVIGVMCRAGAQTMLMNLHRNIDRSKVQFDYLSVITEKEANQDYEEEIKSLGGNLYKFERDNSTQLIQYKKFMHQFLTEHPEYLIVHCHRRKDSIVPLYEAKKAGRIAIMHSHNTRLHAHSPKQFIGNILEHLQRYVADYFFACSKQAGEDQFGSKTKFMFMNNGIETCKYKFSRDIRRKIREGRGVNSEATLVLGHVGTFYHIKNHDFIIDIFENLHKSIPDSKLWLIGRGMLREAIQERVHSLGLDGAVDFIGITNEVNEYLMGMDIFIFPSLQEGLSLALLEAQSSGLPCVISSAINDGIISDRVRKFGVCPPPQYVELWKNALMEGAKIRDHREDYAKRVADAGFDIKGTAKELQDFYLSLV